MASGCGHRRGEHVALPSKRDAASGTWGAGGASVLRRSWSTKLMLERTPGVRRKGRLGTRLRCRVRLGRVCCGLLVPIYDMRFVYGCVRVYACTFVHLYGCSCMYRRMCSYNMPTCLHVGHQSLVTRIHLLHVPDPSEVASAVVRTCVEDGSILVKSG